MAPPTFFTLNNGSLLPTVLYGSYKSTGTDGVDAMVYAIDEAGYRGIDTALFYNNHHDVAQALKKMKTPREEVFLQTKIWPTQMREPEKWLDIALQELGVDYVDMFMIHWPIPLKSEKTVDEDWDFIKTWKLMEKIPPSKAKNIGVSNFTAKQLQKLLDNCSTPPVVNQCEFHPRFPQQELVDFCLKNDVRPQAYRPLAKGQVDNPIIQKIADKHECDVGQVILSWNVIRGVSVLPKSTTNSRIVSNITLVELDQDDMQQIELVGKNPERTCLSLGIYGYDIFDDGK